MSDDSKVADLNDFWPNGRELSDIDLEKRGRQGVGSQVFKQILDDCESHGAEIMYVYTHSESMKEFIAKHSFTQLHHERPHIFFKFLGKNE